MIRDPSDGTVRPVGQQHKPLEAHANISKTGELVSGLPPEKAKQAARLKESREWLKQYFEPKA